MEARQVLAPVFGSEIELYFGLGEGQSASLPLTLQGGEGSASLPVPGAPLTCGVRWTCQDRALRIEIRARHRGGDPLWVEAVGIGFRARQEGAGADWRVFLDAGRCAWCGVKRLDAVNGDDGLGVVPEQRTQAAEAPSGPGHRSSLQSVLFDAQAKEGWLFGFLRQRHGPNGVDVFPRPGEPGRLMRVEAWQRVSTLVGPGDELVVDSLVVMQGSEPLDLLERYAADVQVHHGRSFSQPPVVGMMTWYGYRTAIDRDIVLGNAKAVAELFEGYPQPMQRLMLLDHGWQPDANWGYWDEADAERFPEGMEWLADELRKQGLALGLWYTPFCVTENCPTWEANWPLLARDAQGEPYAGTAGVWGQLPGHSSGRWPVRYLDGGKDEVQTKWRKEMRHMAQAWGCIYHKIDFFHLIASADQQRTQPLGDLYARTYDTFRQAVGEEGHLAPCSCDTNVQLGYSDSIRIAADIGNAGTWPGSMPSYARGLTTIAALWFKHRRFWVNDPDSIQFGTACGFNEARVRATAAAFSGGHLMVSEDLRWVSSDRIEMVRRLLPAYGVAARPLDLFEHVYPDDLPHIWRLPVQSDWGAGDAVAFFNLTEEVMRVTVQPEWFGLSPGTPFGVVEWWQQRWLGRFEGPFEVLVPPADVAVLHAGAYKGYPWLVSVSHHFTGGWIVERLRFDAETSQLHGELVTRPGLRMSLMGTLPPGWGMPPKTSYHGRPNGAGGWAQEVRTHAQRTAFRIQFERQG